MPNALQLYVTFTNSPSLELTWCVCVCVCVCVSRVKLTCSSKVIFYTNKCCNAVCVCVCVCVCV